MGTTPRLSQFSTLLLLLLLLRAPAPVSGDERFGYYVPSGAGAAQVAACSHASTESNRWSTVESTGVCVETTNRSDSGTMTTNYYRGISCNGTSAFGHYIATALDGRGATVNVSFPCYLSCATITVFSASPSVLPSASFIGCPDQLGLPPEARTVYAELPSGITPVSSRPRSSSTGASSQSQPTNSTGSPTSEQPESSGGSSNIPTIIGAVVGSVGGIALILLAFALGRRHAAKARTNTAAAATHQPTIPFEKPELEDTRAGGAVGANDATQQSTWGQAAWDTRQQPPQAFAHAELSSNHPAAHQLSAERGPYEFPGSYGYSYQGQQR